MKVGYIALVTGRRPARPRRHSARLRPQYQRCIDILSAVRVQKNITETELGRRLGKPQSWVDKVESGSRRIDFVEFIEIAQALGEEPDALLRECIERLQYASDKVK